MKWLQVKAASSLTSLQVNFDASIVEYLWNAWKLDNVVLPWRSQLKLCMKIHIIKYLKCIQYNI